MSRSPPLHVLVIEDEMLIAMDIGMMLADAGHEVVGEAASVEDLKRFGPEIDVDLALVDVHLARGSSGIDASAYVRRCWPGAIVVFVTANPSKLPPDFAGAHGVIAKPYTTASFNAVIRYLEQGICDPPPSLRRPGVLTEAPLLKSAWGL